MLIVITPESLDALRRTLSVLAVVPLGSLVEITAARGAGCGPAIIAAPIADPAGRVLHGEESAAAVIAY